MAKEAVCRFRCTEEELEIIRGAAEVEGMNMSEYVISLVKADTDGCKFVDVDAVVYKNTLPRTERRRIHMGKALIDEYGRGSRKAYERISKRAHSLLEDLLHAGSYMDIEVNGQTVDYPNAMSDYAIFDKTLWKSREK